MPESHTCLHSLLSCSTLSILIRTGLGVKDCGRERGAQDLGLEVALLGGDLEHAILDPCVSCSSSVNGG